MATRLGETVGRRGGQMEQELKLYFPFFSEGVREGGENKKMVQKKEKEYLMEHDKRVWGKLGQEGFFVCLPLRNEGKGYDDKKKGSGKTRACHEDLRVRSVPVWQGQRKLARTRTKMSTWRFPRAEAPVWVIKSSFLCEEGHGNW